MYFGDLCITSVPTSGMTEFQPFQNLHMQRFIRNPKMFVQINIGMVRLPLQYNNLYCSLSLSKYLQV